MPFGQERHQIIGNIGKDPSLKTVGDKKCLELSVAVTPVQKLEEGQQARTTWYRCTAWEDRAAQMDKMDFKKGDMICLDLGNLRAEAFMGQDPEYPNDENKKIAKAALKGNIQSFLDIRHREKETDAQNAQEAMKGDPDEPAKSKSRNKMAA